MSWLMCVFFVSLVFHPAFCVVPEKRGDNCSSDVLQAPCTQNKAIALPCFLYFSSLFFTFFENRKKCNYYNYLENLKKNGRFCAFCIFLYLNIIFLGFSLLAFPCYSV